LINRGEIIPKVKKVKIKFMDSETKNLLKILGVAVVILYLTRPKSKGKKTSIPKNQVVAVLLEEALL